MTSSNLHDNKLNANRRKTVGELAPRMLLDVDNCVCNAGARRFDGVNQSFTFDGWGPGLGDFAFDFWVNSTQAAGTLYRGHNSTTFVGLTVSIVAGNVLRVSIGNGSAMVNYDTAGGILPYLTNAHVVVNGDRDGLLSIFVNDMVTPAATHDITALVAVNVGIGNTPHRVGGNSTTTSIAAAMSRLGVVSGSTLTLAQRQESHNGGRGKRYAEMSADLQAAYLHFFDMAEPTGNCADSAGSATLTEYNGPIAAFAGPDGRGSSFADDDPVIALSSRTPTLHFFRNDTAANRPTAARSAIGVRAAMTFDGTNDCLTCYQPTLLSGDKTTLCIAFHTQATRFAAVQTLFAFSDVGATNEYGRVGIDAEGYPFVEVNDSGTVHKVTGSTLLELDTSYALMVRCDGSAWSMQLGRDENDEVLKVTTANSGKWYSDLTGIDVVTLGCLTLSSGNTDFFSGKIGQVCLWNEYLPDGVARSVRNQVSATGQLLQPALYDGLVEPSYQVNTTNWSATDANTTEAAESILTNNPGGSYRVNSSESATYIIAQHTPASPADWTGKALRMRFYIDDLSKISTLRLYGISGASGTADNYTFTLKKTYLDNGWNSRAILAKDLTAAGSPALNNIRYWYLRASRASGTPFMVMDHFAVGYTGPAVLILSTDDGNDDNIDILAPLLAARGLSATAFVNTSTIGAENKCTLTDLESLYAAGWDISSHSHTHTDADTLTEQQLHDEYGTAYDTLIGWGFGRSARFHAYPFNSTNATAIQVAKQYFDAARSWSPERWIPQPNGLDQTYHWSSYATDALDITEWQTLIDDGIAAGEVMITYGHFFDAIPIEDMLDYAVAKRDAGQLLMMTMSEFYQWQANRFAPGWHPHNWSA